MKVRERMGTGVRTMVKLKVTKDGDKRQDDGECDYGNMGERRTSTRVSTRGYRQSGHNLRCNDL